MSLPAATLPPVRNFGLDVVRAVSIVLVLLSHTWGACPVALGVLGVEMFFVLSGFLIGQILLKDFNQSVTFSAMLHFWKRRWFRTLPLYYLVIIGRFLMFDSSIGWGILAYIFFLQNHIVGVSFYRVTWSLTIEEWFYLLMPFSFLLFMRRGIRSPRKLVFVLVAIIVGVSLLRVLYVQLASPPWQGVRPNVPLRMDALATGVLLAAFKVHLPVLFNNIARWLWGALALAVLILLMWQFGRTDLQTTPVAAWFSTGWFNVLSLCIAVLIAGLSAATFWMQAGRIKWLAQPVVWISLLTYSLYLLHMPVFRVVEQTLKGLHIVWIVAAQYAVALMVCAVVYRFYELPMMNLREKKWKV